MKKILLFLILVQEVLAQTSISVTTPTIDGGTRTDNRTFRFHLPSASPACSLHVLFVFSGDGGTSEGIESATGFSALAEAYNFIAVYPDKLAGRSYFSYRIDQPAYLNGQIDSSFIMSIIKYLHTNYGIDRNRVYATGISSGANMTYFASAKLTHAFAAFAPVAGFPQDYSGSSVWQNIVNNNSTPKVPVLHIHGTADVTSGTQFSSTNLPTPYPSTPPSNNNGWIWPMFPLSNKSCNNAPGNYTGDYFMAGNTTVDRLTFCPGGGSNKEVSMMIVRGMGHTWPTSSQTGGIDGSLAIWNFVKDYQLSVYNNPAPVVLPNGSSINAGQSITLTATCADGYGFLWNTGATSSEISVSPNATITYTAYCTYGINCQSPGTDASVVVKPPCNEDLVISGSDYPDNTVSGSVNLNASNSIKTFFNIDEPTAPSYVRTFVGNSANLNLHAGKSVLLNPGFQVNEGAVFTAAIASCNNSSGYEYLKVEGTKIKNKCGTDFVIKGVNFGGYWQYDVNNRMNALNRIPEIKKAGTNAVRLPWSANTQYSRDYKVLDTLLRHITASKMIVVVEFHDLTCQNLTQANIKIATDYWLSADVLAVLKKYENYLILNIANEVGNDWQGNTPAVVQKMIDAYTPSIVALRSAGIKCPITIDATDCGQNIEALVSAAPALLANDPDHNLIFSAHLYWNNNNYTTRLTNAYNSAVASGICLIVGEFSVAQDCLLNSTQNDYVAVMKVCNQYGIGYLAWEWGGSLQYAGNGSLCPADDRGPTYSRLAMTGSSGMYTDLAGWGVVVANDILATSVESCQFNP